MSLHAHFAHLEDGIEVREGEWVTVGKMLGRVGSTGNSTSSHLHFEIMNRKPEHWRRYVIGKPYNQILKEYIDPRPFIREVDGKTVPADDDESRRGYGWMQFVRYPGGDYWHPGVDINSMFDFGKPIYSPVEGRVVHVEDVSWIKNWTGGWTNTVWNGGWGRHIWIEVSPAWLKDSGIVF